MTFLIYILSDHYKLDKIKYFNLKYVYKKEYIEKYIHGKKYKIFLLLTYK